jgi:Autotransporter beta-domain
MTTYTQKALAAASALLLGVPTAALSHTNSIGYVGAGNGTVTFWYGNWHPGTTFTEGSMTLLGVNGTNYSANTVNWTLLQNTLPTGLVNGTNYFTSDGTQLVPYGSNSQVSYTWQGVTFTGLGAGDYQFTYNPIAQPTANWAPMDNIIKTSTVSLSSAIINNTCNTCQGTSAPTVTSTAPGSDIVTTTTTYGTRTVTGHPHRHVFGTDADGNQTETHYLDDAVTTIPTTTVTTTTTPVTVTTWSDGSTTTTNGTPTTTSVTTDDNGGTTVVTQTNNIEWVKTRTYNIVPVSTLENTASESGGVQKITAHTTTTTTTTPVYTKVYTDGVTPNVVTTDPATVDVAHTYKDYFGRVDQLETLGNVSDAVNGLLNHEPTAGKQKIRVFDNNYFIQSYNADGYKANSTIFGGGLEVDVSKGWTLGFQYNQANINLSGVDSSAHQSKQHYGIFSEIRGNTLTLNTNAALASNKYSYSRNVEGVFNNSGETTGNEWWVSNRLYLHLTKWLHPFVGYTIQNVKRNAYTETGSPESARVVDAFNQTTHVGEAGLKLETRFGGKKHNVFGISIDGSYGTDNSYGVTGSLDYKEVLFVEGSHSVNNGMANNSIAGRIKFKF